MVDGESGARRPPFVVRWRTSEAVTRVFIASSTSFGRVVPSGRFERPHTPPEGDALSPELRGRDRDMTLAECLKAPIGQSDVGVDWVSLGDPFSLEDVDRP